MRMKMTLCVLFPLMVYVCLDAIGASVHGLLTRSLVIQAVVFAVHVHGGSLFLLVEKLGLEIPVVDSSADREFKIFFGNGVPELLRNC
jgi:hypothetical protein